jgi:carotenoid 1,2-hydratase
MNVALYSRGASAWALEERRVPDVARAADHLTIGASTMRWDAGGLRAEIDERSTPFGRPVRGRVLLHPQSETKLELAVDEAGEHRWWPVAPLARIEVKFSEPKLCFSGHGYHDANAGAAALEDTFENWNWSRARAQSGALLTYDVDCASGARRSLAFRVSPGGEVRDVVRVHSAPLPRTVWGLERRARVDDGQAGRVVRTLEDGPFYARSLVDTQLGGHRVLAMHETLAAHRLRRRWVRALVSCRMRCIDY